MSLRDNVSPEEFKEIVREIQATVDYLVDGGAPEDLEATLKMFVVTLWQPEPLVEEFRPVTDLIDELVVDRATAIAFLGGIFVTSAARKAYGVDE